MRCKEVYYGLSNTHEALWKQSYRRGIDTLVPVLGKDSAYGHYLSVHNMFIEKLFRWSFQLKMNLTTEL